MPENKAAVSSRKGYLRLAKYDLKNLKFLGDFMAALDLTTTKAGEIAGISQVAVYYWLKKDDAHLSSIDHLIDACGYKLKFELVDENETPSMVNIVVAEGLGERKLDFLADALKDVDRDVVAKALDINPATIYYWLSHDDIFVSYIYRIADAIGRKVKITISPK